jgi:hypothetical protein
MCQAIGSFCGSTCCSLDLGRIQMKRWNLICDVKGNSIQCYSVHWVVLILPVDNDELHLTFISYWIMYWLHMYGG